MKKGCLFDLDGTLVDSIKDLALSTNIILQKHGLPTHDIEKYQNMVGNGVRKLMSRALQDRQDLLEECLDEFYQYYQEHCLDNTKPYDGIIDMIKSLKQMGIKLAVVTNKPHHLAVKIVDTLFPDTFEVVFGQQKLYPTKPDAASSLLAMMTLKVSKEECYFIGDSDVDIETAYQAGIESIGVQWGFRGYQELYDAGACHIITCPKQIVELIKNENRI